MKKWYTRPEEGFSSYYYYDDLHRELVRIRLELGRDPSESDDGGTVAAYHEDHYVGFSEHGYDNMKLSGFTLSENGTILDNKDNRLGDIPKQNSIVYDFSSTDGIKPSRKVHRGNTVVDDRWASLPNGITQIDLERLAEICLRDKSSIRLTDRDASEEELAAAIRAIIGPAPVGGTTTTKSRCCRCTII
jgi:hypothetical protein